MRDIIQAALKGHNADYIEVRLEENASARIAYRGRDLEELGRTTNRGGNVRAMARGGWGFVSFNDLDDLGQRVTMAVAQARLAGAGESALAPIQPAQEVVEPFLKRDPRQVPLADKKAYVDLYNDLILSTPGVQSSNVAYGESYKKITFASTEGAFIEQSRVEATFRLVAVARRDGDVQQSGFSIGRLGDFSFVEELHHQARAAAEKAVAMLSAPAVRGGEYTVVLDPILAGVFCHEAFGHLSESDFVYENPQLQELMVLGKRFGQPLLNIVDGAAIPGLRGSFTYDDEGTPARRSDLIREGILVGRLHSRETAGRMGEQPTGNARALDYRFPPIVRMTNTLIEPGEVSFEDMIAEIKEGVYVKNWYGGQTSMEMFTFSAGEAYMIRNGRVAELLRPVVLTGNVFTTLMNLDAVGNDTDINQGGGCGKAGQSPLPVSNGSPHIRIQQCLVGGR
ncbi:MAG: TldD/PmbA family protein [Chloroflexi bacterium]|nr:TldD/PmbA family protein [Chloroflexota bacterium]